MIIVLIFLLFLSIVGVAIILRRAGGGKFPWIQFYAKGKEAGFNFRELNLLRKIAVENKLDNPTSLFWSTRQLDRSIKEVIVKLRSEGKEQSGPGVEVLSKLFDFRKKVEFDLPRYKLGIKSTGGLPTRQRLTFSFQESGPYHTTVVENLRKYMAVSYPEGPALPPDFSWKNHKIDVSFRRTTDAAYMFQTTVLEDFREKDHPILHIAHSDTLKRIQKRRSVRVEVNEQAQVYPVANLDEASKQPENKPGLRSRLLDLSEDGAAVLVGGKAKVGLPVKLQFTLSDTAVVMIGIVKGMSVKQQKNQSVLHIEASPVSTDIKNRILSYVYNLFGERKIRSQPQTA